MSGENGNIVIYGCGGHSRSVIDVLLASAPGTSLLLVDDHAKDAEKILGFDVHRQYILGDEQVFLAIGDNQARKKKMESLGQRNYISIISSLAHRGHSSTIEVGCFIGNFCHVGPLASIGRNTILNTASVIEHEVKIGAHCHIGPNASISGRCKIGDLVFVGVGATVKDYISICDNVTIGAGATVVNDISEPGIYVGTPARRMK